MISPEKLIDKTIEFKSCNDPVRHTFKIVSITKEYEKLIVYKNKWL